MKKHIISIAVFIAALIVGAILTIGIIFLADYFKTPTVCKRCGSHNLTTVYFNHGEHTKQCEDCGYTFLFD